MAKVEKNCQFCDKLFLADSREINRGNGKYCSQSCASKAPKQLQYNQICKHCGKEFLSASKNAKYCSDSCKQKNYRLRQKSTFEDSLSIKSYYKLFENIPCELCSWNKTSRDLHHIVEVANGGTNELNNLISVCPNCHRMIHNNLITEDILVQVIKNRSVLSSK